VNVTFMTDCCALTVHMKTLSEIYFFYVNVTFDYVVVNVAVKVNMKILE
jgi:hypothetical protein